MIVVDTTVLVYAVGDEHPLRDPCRRLVELVRDGDLAATTTVEVVQEFVHVRARRRGRADAARLGSDIATLFDPLVRPDSEHLRRGLDLYRRSEHLGTFDAVLAATALATPGATLVSADRGFAAVPGLRHLDPGAEGFEASLRVGGSR